MRCRGDIAGRSLGDFYIKLCISLGDLHAMSQWGRTQATWRLLYESTYTQEKSRRPRCDLAAISLRRRCDLATATLLRSRKCDIAAISPLRRRCDLATATSLRPRHCDVAATSLRRRCDVAATQAQSPRMVACHT